ncbi:DNA topoisomerase III [Paenibacillus cymbidii]|uniref:DNA topoisomerase III n=1 Tax=Paenibacillus cymbidii TaxID=1639034 RepID=UPI001080E3AC|nr:DNA topoisomerase 3 [Paenibacillus cymbidii]
MKALVLAEKPSVAKEIARVLGCHNKQKSYHEGPNYVVTWALGHLVTLAEPEDYDDKYKTWKLEDLPIIPDKMKLKVIKETSHQFRAIEQLSKRADLSELVIATDAGREGELVARWIMELIRWKKPFKRLWISSQTDQAIREGFAKLKPGAEYNRLFQSAVCRSEADWLIGLNITRALTSKYDAQLAAGRVQTPTLATMIAREEEIRRFQPVEYWTLTADFGGFQGQWRGANQEARIFDKAKAEAIRAKVSGKQGRIVRVRKTEKTIPQPLAYDLTELQRDASNRYGFSAKQTSSLLQRLYEQHKLVTYPRTDSRYLTSDMAPTLKGRLERIAVGPYAQLAGALLRKPLAIGKRIVDDSKVSDHHAIIPTDQYVNMSALSNEERKLYDLIVRRFIALFYAPCRFDQTSVVVDVAGESFHASGSIMKEAGWKEVYGTIDLSDPDDNEDGANGETADRLQEQALPPVREGETVAMRECRERSQFTKPPGRYTEAALLTAMERGNLGTPATRADIIEKLLGTDTIERSGSTLRPTGKGTQLIELAASELRSPELTAQWELELERIAKGQGSMEKFLSGIRGMTQTMVQAVKASDAVYKPHNLTHSRCPQCSQLLQEIKGKRGLMLVCSNRECDYRRAGEPQLINKRCPTCSKKMEIHTGKAGKYAQCRRCNVIEMLEGDKASSGGGRKAARNNRELINQYSDKESLGSSLADALKAAMEKNNS